MGHAEYKSWTASRELTFHHSAAFMDYLHGDLKNVEAEFACLYEYARESAHMWDAVKLRDEARTRLNLDCATAYWQILHYVEDWIKIGEWSRDFLMCESFPNKDWNELSELERQKIFHSERRKVEPLQMPDLHYSGFAIDIKKRFNEFQTLAEASKPVIEVHDPQSGKFAQPPILVPAMTNKKGPIYYCVFMVDFSESAKHLSQRFVEWLNQLSINLLWRKHRKERSCEPRKPLHPKRDLNWEGTRGYWCLFEVNLSAGKTDLAKHFKRWIGLPKNQERLKQHYEQKRGKSDKWKDRLKDLAAWRLYRENGNSLDRANAFAENNRKRFENWPEIHEACKKVKNRWPFKPGDLKPFRDAKQTGNDPLNRAPLFAHDDDYRHAKGRALKFLAEKIPSEFKESYIMKEVKRLFTASFNS
jgi:hypothetical protein